MVGGMVRDMRLGRLATAAVEEAGRTAERIRNPVYTRRTVHVTKTISGVTDRSQGADTDCAPENRFRIPGVQITSMPAKYSGKWLSTDLSGRGASSLRARRYGWPFLSMKSPRVAVGSARIP